MFGILLDDATDPKFTTQALTLSKELQNIIDGFKTPQNDVQAMLSEIGAIIQGNKIIADLMALSGDKSGSSLVIDENPAQPLEYPRKATAQYYNFVETTTKGTRQKQNNAAFEIVDKYLKGEIKLEDITPEQKIILGKYSGNGGNLIDNLTGQHGSAFEYYTPVPIANGIWDALAEMGFSGGKVLDPCGGTGIFGATAPLSAAVDTVELDVTSGTVNKLINESDSFKVKISNFEKIAADTPDEIYDAVVSNVPFGDNREGNQFDDPKYQNETLENYFILRSLDKLKPNGLAAFIVPPRCVSGKGGADEKTRFRASLKAEFLGAYRLPNKVFGAANADTITDVIFFRKFSKSAAEKIAELKESSPETLSKSNVLWDEYINGAYFNNAEGQKHVLGEFVPKDPNKFRDVNRVNNAASIPDIAKLMRKLPKSRIDWAMLEETETSPIVYNEGDTISQDGQILQLKNGEWVVLEKPKANLGNVERTNNFETPLKALNSGMTYEDMVEYSSYLINTAQYDKIPRWLKNLQNSLVNKGESESREAYLPCLVGLTVLDVLDVDGRDSGTNFLEKYPKLSELMRENSVLAKRLKIKGRAKVGLDNIGFHYDRKNGFSNLWTGNVALVGENIEVTQDAGFEGLIYKNKSIWVSIDDAKTIYGENFNPLNSDEWCISDDGLNVARADDYYIGNVGKFLSNIDQSIADTDDEAIKTKLLRQKVVAFDRIDKVNAESMKYNIRSPYVTNEEKIDFLKTYIHEKVEIEVDDYGKEKIKFNFSSGEVKDDFDLKIYKRFALYIESGNATLGTADFDGEDAEAIKRLRELISRTNEQFNGWVRSNKRITDRLNAIANDPARLQFTQIDDESPLVIQGMNQDLALHGYQNAFARKMGRGFEGINGFDVGLGKTFTGLASVQYVQSIGVKKKTLFVVPNSVLSNWKKEASKAYTSIDDCLFVGLREVDGKMVSDSSSYDADLHKVLENNHSKVFMTMEAFERIKLKNETILDFEAYMRVIDSSFAESEDRKKDSKAKNKVKSLVQVLTDKTGSAPYFEDMGFDSIVIDEAHSYKNSSSTVEFKGGKYLSVADASKRGMDAQAKAWFIRGKSAKGDGVLLLTATPITNSPLEIYSMLSLAVGHGRVNDLALGTNGADSFMLAVCRMVNEEEEGIDGSMRDMQVFHGLDNTAMLRRAINSVATIKTAKDVGKTIFVPDAMPTATDVSLTPEIIEQLQKYKLAYRYAAAIAKEKELPDEGEDEYEEVKEKFGETDEVLGHPFNLIRKMTNLILDPDLDEMLTSYVFSETDKESMESLVNQWNKKKPTEERSKLSPHTKEADILSVKKPKSGSTEAVKYKIAIRAWIDGNRVCFDSTNWKIQDKFEEFAEKSKVDLDVTIPPKFAALLENFKNEAATPRGIIKDENGKEVKLPYAKQLIFCDMLGVHNKIKKMLVKHAGVSADKIIIVTGQRNNDPADLLEIQDGFNAYEDNKYQIVIANEKAEVGINLQQGTQANHHLTIGWTPDSLQQRNGRSARQGNLTDRVMSYYYDAEGTFDTAKRTLVNSKAEWIDNLSHNSDSNEVEIVGGMSKEMIDSLINVVGDADSVARIQKERLEHDKRMKIEANRAKQLVNLNTIVKENKFLKNNQTSLSWVAKAMGELMVEYGKSVMFLERMSNEKATETAIAKNKKLHDESQLKINVLVDYINDAATFYDYVGNGQVNEYTTKYDPIKVVQMFRQNAKRGEASTSDFIENIKASRVTWKSLTIVVNEDSELQGDWQSQVEMSKKIRATAVQDYEDQASKDGAFAKGVTAEFLDGNGGFVGDHVLTKNSFIIKDNDPKKGLFAVGSGIVGYAYISGLEDGEKVNSSTNNLLVLSGNWSVVYPNSDLYEKCLSVAAKFEDDAFNAGNLADTSYFSQSCELVKTHKSSDSLVRYSFNYMLPSPYFPKVFTPDEINELTPVRQHIKESQDKVIHSVDGSAYWVKDSIVCVYKRDDSDLLNQQIVDYALAHNLKAKINDMFGVIDSIKREYVSKKVRESSDIEVINNLIEDATSIEVLDNSLLRYFSDTIQWFDFSTLSATQLLPYGVQFNYNDKARSLRKAQQESVSGNTVEPVPIVEPTDSLVNNTVDATRISKDLFVRVTGDGTKDNKERFKALSSSFIRKNPSFVKPSYWRGKDIKWLGSVTAWEFPYGAWLEFAEQFPSQLDSLNVEIRN